MPTVSSINEDEMREMNRHVDATQNMIESILLNKSESAKQYFYDRLFENSPKPITLDKPVQNLISEMQKHNRYDHGTLLSVAILYTLSEAESMIKSDIVKKLVGMGFRANPESKNKSISKDASEELKLTNNLGMKFKRMADDGYVKMTALSGNRHQKFVITTSGGEYLKNMIENGNDEQKLIYAGLNFLKRSNNN